MLSSRWCAALLFSACLGALMFSLGGCVKAPAAEYPVSLERLLPAGESLEISSGNHRSFVVYQGQCPGFSHGGISFSGKASAVLEVSLRADDDSESFSTISLKLPAKAGSLKFRDFGEAREFFEIDFRVKSEGEGLASILEPKLLRSVARDRLVLKASQKMPEKPNIFFIMIDTLRKDRLGCYGGDGGRSPNIDALAGDSILFDDAVAQSPWTRPSVASMFTGLHPYEHGVTDRDDALPEKALLLPERLKAAGYETHGVITNGNVCAKFGFDQGFDSFIRGGGPAKKDGSHALGIAKEIVDARDPAKPFFMYFHLSDPHAPYHPPAEFREKWAPGVDPAVATRDALRDHRSGAGLNDELEKEIESLYDGEVAFVDHLVGDFVEHLRGLGLYDSSVVILVADHGEEFWEHGIWGHGGSLYPVLLEVPMMLKLPGQSEGVRSRRLVEHIDILPTLLSLAGADESDGLPGINLAEEEIPKNRIIFSSVNKAGLTGVAATTGRWKLIEARSGLFSDTLGALRFFDRKKDPGETQDLSGENPPELRMLKRMLDDEIEMSRRRHSSKVSIRGQLRKELEALGYIEAGEKLQSENSDSEEGTKPES